MATAIHRPQAMPSFQEVTAADLHSYLFDDLDVDDPGWSEEEKTMAPHEESVMQEGAEDSQLSFQNLTRDYFGEDGEEEGNDFEEVGKGGNSMMGLSFQEYGDLSSIIGESEEEEEEEGKEEEKRKEKDDDDDENVEKVDVISASGKSSVGLAVGCSGASAGKTQRGIGRLASVGAQEGGLGKSNWSNVMGPAQSFPTIPLTPILHAPGIARQSALHPGSAPRPHSRSPKLPAAGRVLPRPTAPIKPSNLGQRTPLSTPMRAPTQDSERSRQRTTPGRVGNGRGTYAANTPHRGSQWSKRDLDLDMSGMVTDEGVSFMVQGELLGEHEREERLQVRPQTQTNFGRKGGCYIANHLKLMHECNLCRAEKRRSGSCCNSARKRSFQHS